MVRWFGDVRAAAMAAGIAAGVAAPGAAQTPQRGQVIEVTPTPRAATPSPPGARGPRDTSGRAREGNAGVVDAARLRARGIAPGDAVAGSATLPPGATARVRNLETGQETVVGIADLGPVRGDLLVEVTPGVAQRLGLRGGNPAVRVAPLAVPQPDGTIRLGEGTGLAGRVAAPAVSERPVD